MNNDAASDHDQFFRDRIFFLLVVAAIFFIVILSGYLNPSWSTPEGLTKHTHRLLWCFDENTASIRGFPLSTLRKMFTLQRAAGNYPFQKETGRSAAQKFMEHVNGVRGIQIHNTKQVRIVQPPATATPLLLLPIPVNQADENILMTLSGVGPVLAHRLVSFRRVHGPFHDARDLGGVKGFTPGRVKKIAPYLSFRPE